MELKIEKLVYGGDGLARLPANERGRGKAVFIPFVLEGEQVDAEIIEEKPGFARARLQRVVEPSPHRTDPRCPYFTQCGGCHYQHSSYDHQLDIKASILKENLRRIAKLELRSEIRVHPSPAWNYRNRTRFRVQASPEFALGYYRFGSHALLPIEECKISSPLINRAIRSLWEVGRAGKIAESVLEIELFTNADDSQLLVEVYVDPQEASSDRNQVWADTLRGALPEFAGVALFPAAPREVASKSEAKPIVVSGSGELVYRTALAAYRVSAGSFFQINRHLTDELLQIVTATRSGLTALDLYAGVGLFSAVLSREFERVIAVESSQQSAADLAYNVPANAKAVRATAEQYLTNVAGKVRPDLVVLDPPRSGLGSRVARAIAELAPPVVTYVSCDPATLARDLVPL
ncbi:MAG TPA: 23S rRNA (uracil(1939)-C(5))-methyltransferase RlmD, partial [Terriglobales bacterium]|nr:23S rRNA (uracil(1939)-C(5))-methyltransferase RlmD [Terriglobales bacterium]